MVRTPGCDKSGLKKGTWTPEEDRKLIAYVTRYGCWNWRQLPKFAGLSRCGKSCRLRWMNYLRPNLKRGTFSKEEDETISKLHKTDGNKWSMIATHLPGRTDNEIKNHWHTTLKKKHSQQDLASKEAKMNTNDASKIKGIKQKESKPNDSTINISSHEILESSPISPQQSSSDQFSSTSTDAAAAITSTNWLAYDNEANSSESFGEFDENFWTEPFVADSLQIPHNISAPFIDPEFSFPHSPVFGGELLGQIGFYEEDGYCFGW